jgi:glycosyltransferase involved in cell wall biosynthesis
MKKEKHEKREKREKISVVTVTQWKRFSILKLVVSCLYRQSTKADEWVIVDGNSNPEDAALLAEQMVTLRDEAMISIVYVPFQSATTLGELRNRGNMACKGDIIICFDDDDYYPPTRIQHVVEQFKEHPHINIAGCSKLLIHDYTKLQFYQCNGFNDNHSTNSAMAWRKVYLKNHSYDNTKKTGEEAGFTNNFTEPMIQLNPLHTVVLSAHCQNTFDKSNTLNDIRIYTPLHFKLMPTLMDAMVYRKFLAIFREMENALNP